MYDFTYHEPTRLICGTGKLQCLPEEIRQMGRRALLISDPGLVKAGLFGKMEEIVKNAGVEFYTFTDIESNPTDKTLRKCIALGREKEIDVFVGFGGGSAMDVAKGAAIMRVNEEPFWQYANCKLPNGRAKIICVPTTAGTGSEMSTSAVFINTETTFKYGIGGTYEFMPDIAIIDPELTLELPPRITAETGMDALCHAVESYTNTFYNPLCSALAIEAVRLIAKSLRIAVLNGKNMEARTNMLLGSTMASMAFSIKKLSDVHALSHPISAHFGTSHGLSNAVLLPIVMEYNYLANPQAFADVALAMGVNTFGMTVNEAACASVRWVKQLMVDIGMPFGLKEFKNVSEEKLDILCKDALKSSNVKVNARLTSYSDAMNLYRRLESFSPAE